MRLAVSEWQCAAEVGVNFCDECAAVRGVVSGMRNVARSASAPYPKEDRKWRFVLSNRSKIAILLFRRDCGKRILGKIRYRDSRNSCCSRNDVSATVAGNAIVFEFRLSGILGGYVPTRDNSEVSRLSHF